MKNEREIDRYRSIDRLMTTTDCVFIISGLFLICTNFNPYARILSLSQEFIFFNLVISLGERKSQEIFVIVVLDLYYIHSFFGLESVFSLLFFCYSN